MRGTPATASTRMLNQRLRVLSAPESAAQVIRDAIIVGDLKSGERLVEQKWASRFGIGQPTLREALKELERQGFVQKTPQRGTYVAHLGEQDYRRILEARIPLEAIAFKRAAQKITADVEEELSSLVMQMGRAGESSDLVAFHETDVAFHRKIWDLAENEYLRICLEAICFRLFVFSVVGRQGNWFRAAVQQHLGYLAGLCSRDAQQAQDAFIHHTLKYWNNHYNVNLTLESVPTLALP